MKARKLFGWYRYPPKRNAEDKLELEPLKLDKPLFPHAPEIGPETPGRLELEAQGKLWRGLEVKTRGRGRPRARSQSAKDEAAALIGLSRLKALELNLKVDAILKRFPDVELVALAEAAADLAFQAGQMAERAKRAKTLAVGLAVMRRLRRRPD